MLSLRKLLQDEIAPGMADSPRCAGRGLFGIDDQAVVTRTVHSTILGHGGCLPAFCSVLVVAGAARRVHKNDGER
jgi:hypothetical protein